MRTKPLTKEQRVFLYRRKVRNRRPKAMAEVRKLGRQKYGNISSDEIIEYEKQPEKIPEKQVDSDSSLQRCDRIESLDINDAQNSLRRFDMQA